MTQIHGIRFLPKTSVGRMQYAPTRGRKWYVRGCGIRFLPKTFVGRMQYAPTRGRKWYAWDYVVRDWGRKWYVQDCGVRFLPKTSVGRMQYAPTRGRKWHMPIRIHHFKPYKPFLRFCKVLVWDREGRVRSCGGIAWAENIK